MSGPSASLKNSPPTSGRSSSKCPSARTGFTTGIALARIAARSSAPKAGARWTSPVPSSVVTKVPLTTRCAPGMESISERGRVRRAEQLAAAERGEHVPAFAEHPWPQRLGDHHPVPVTALARDHVLHLGVDGDRGVGHERPRRRRPHQQVGPGQVRVRALGHPGHGEPDDDRGVGDVPVDVRLAHLVVGQRRAAPGAVRADPEVPHEQALVVDRLERPPDGLHVVGVHGAVGGGQVDPVPHPGGERGERVDVPQHRLPAPLVELGDAVGLDVLLAGQAEFLLHGDLHGQPVAVPAGLAGDVEPLHGLEPGKQVLEDPGLDVVHARHAVRRGRPLVERPPGRALRLAERRLERPHPAPPGQHLVLDRGQVRLRGQGRHRAAPVALRLRLPAARALRMRHLRSGCDTVRSGCESDISPFRQRQRRPSRAPRHQDSEHARLRSARRTQRPPVPGPAGP